MQRFRVFFGLTLMSLLAVAPPLPAQCPPEQVPVTAEYSTYYSDYFSTAVGYFEHTCEGQESSWGTLDGAYWELIWVGCCGSSQSGRRCYQKSGGNWVSISCP